MRARAPRRSRAAGYILFEAVLAMGVLSVGIIGVQRAMREAIISRAQARDFTQACFLLEELIAELELQPQLVESSYSGQFEGDLSRFRWKAEVSRIDLPEPPRPPEMSEEEYARLKLQVKYVAKIEATVSWTREKQEFERTFETVWSPEKIYVPPEEREQML